ncbi:alpha/beta fold hydrolase [Sphingobium subterraneum]|uniref:Microsomal epoxide hydrolase n=1 Tax=Sphingobium subterraneum TaxID=627688 RepID=A0A841IXG9_9SPHN|nr:alpha/beta hydrolase [Sphingobium subterraneum]MBB6123064.1 microsomal epoxide hydrolase [Sphingobium subterraneum]
MTTTQHGNVKTSDGISIHYTDTGEGRAIVLIPGWLSEATIWEHQITELSKRYRVIAIDPRSQGESDKPSTGHLPEDRARDYKDVVDALGLKQPVMVGWSMACGELMSYVEQFGDDELGGIVLVDGLLPPDKNPDVIPILAYFTNLLQKNRQQAIDEFIPFWYKTEQSESYLDFVKGTTEKVPTNSAVALMHNMVSNNDLTGAFARLTRPVIFAYQDLLQGGAEYLKSQLGDKIQLERFANEGHALFVDNPTKFNDMIETFIRRLP